MTRLQTQWHRLYASQANADQIDTSPEASIELTDAQGQARAMVLELSRPAEWAPLATLWHGVQADLGWPAPAIAINGIDGYQLWFSLQTPVELAQASAVLHALCGRYLPDVAPHRLRLMPNTHTASTEASQHAVWMPGVPVQADQWSAFVAQDLAPVFAETPWLDVQPSMEGQAELLSRLHSIPAEAFQAALDTCRQPAQGASAPHDIPRSQASAGTNAARADNHDDPRRFLLNVMNDTTVALALRIEAAKALLPYAHHDKGPG
ncbi:MAG TPA: hypothetical protein VFW93_13040 [Aquabacterium sp.]|uniref:hypothetical protein n=1 Tax=Aquabacterium sp. TaxID=1872578 RepID=UPI002E326A22|nr:hypothetical protein [Aquabacterium sp.]HEX5357139.1 hypothetical protein [Aquabacterium sp.]